MKLSPIAAMSALWRKRSSRTSSPQVKTTAILAIRNEQPYIANCLTHLIENGLDFVVIDNGSTDGTLDILAEPRFAPHLRDLIHFPYPGFFDWTGLMEHREAAAKACDSDWVLFVSADEIMHSYRDGEQLCEAISRIAATGAEAINFDEFVFVPIDKDYVSNQPGPQPLAHYYFFEPSAPRLMRARRRDLDVSHIQTGGHVLGGADFNLSSERMALRHYVFRDQAHARAKYPTRVFSRKEVEENHWHGNRDGIAEESFVFPAANRLHRIAPLEARQMDKSAPYKTHFWQWETD